MLMLRKIEIGKTISAKDGWQHIVVSKTKFLNIKYEFLCSTNYPDCRARKIIF